jgi:voltage-gated potassium channel
VGYGDLYPTTWEGRLVAGSLMIGGIALLGVITATIASWLLEKIRASEDALETKIHEESTVLRAEMDRLCAEISQLNANPHRPAGPTRRPTVTDH